MEKRKNWRARLPGRPQGLLNVGTPVRVLDLSPTGAMIEHAGPLSPGATVRLGLRLIGVDLRLRARVAWCCAYSASLDSEEEQRFRSGLHFTEIHEGAEVHLRHYLATLGTPKAHLLPAFD